MQLTPILVSGLSLTALASSAPVEPSSTSSVTAPITFRQDTRTQKYRCAGRDVIRCETPRAEVASVCIPIDTCESFCFLHDNGAACVDMGAPPVPKVPVSARIAARAASSEEHERNECSKDRTGVLICRYGFCSIGYYCKAGFDCQDGSFTCVPKSPPLGTVMSEVRDVPPQAEVEAIESNDNTSYTCSEDRASVLRCLYGFCSTDCYCADGHPCVDNPARCKKMLNAQSDQ
ncbi:hypothetical protein N0V91_010060 [Didymella pomorum]|jgi:hypothetical protein|uniref:Uncharacterized protein n=1 Tax=Didymella pomorum TaxID=749634 RepID=A0A9W9D3S9_9PLEO|nr:hypothetical protein N0V91_010060 [Didymella pomorum]